MRDIIHNLDGRVAQCFFFLFFLLDGIQWAHLRARKRNETQWLNGKIHFYMVFALFNALPTLEPLMKQWISFVFDGKTPPNTQKMEEMGGVSSCSLSFKETCTEMGRCKQSCIWQGKKGVDLHLSMLQTFHEDPKESYQLGHPMTPLKNHGVYNPESEPALKACSQNTYFCI